MHPSLLTPPTTPILLSGTPFREWCDGQVKHGGLTRTVVAGSMFSVDVNVGSSASFRPASSSAA